MNDPFAPKRAAMIREFYGKLFLLGGFIGGTDTYKRTMWTAVPDIAVAPAAYALTMRRPFSEPGAGAQLIMAGHEAMLSQWFHAPLERADLELAERWFSSHAHVKAFPKALWDSLLASQSGPQIHLPVDVWGFAGGQTFLAGAGPKPPCLSFEGPGGIISYLEPAMCRYFAPIIQATKARLMLLSTPRDAEFGLRSAVNEAANLVLLLARYVGGRGSLTSNDTAEFMFPELFQSLGTIGHEMMCANQSLGPDHPTAGVAAATSRPAESLGESEFAMMERYVTAMGTASLLCDLVDATTVGFENALRVLSRHPEAGQVGVRIDSGDITAQVVQYYEGMLAAGLQARTIVFEDEVSPQQVERVYHAFRQHTGREPEMLFPGAGGYWWRLVHRDELSAAFKRTATENRPNTKFSNSPGKESLSGYLRVLGRGDTLLVCDVSEQDGMDGEPLFVKLVDQGRIVYDEPFPLQAERADRTWGRYQHVTLSPKVAAWQEAFRARRELEVQAATRRLKALV